MIKNIFCNIAAIVIIAALFFFSIYCLIIGMELTFNAANYTIKLLGL